MGFTLSGITIDGSVTLTSAFVPNAPTIGTAARVSGSATEIDVPFTASSNNGNSVILSYTAVSTPGSITGTLSQASSGTIRVSGLTTGTSYTFVVYATNGVGNSPNSAASNAVIPLSVPTAPTIGTVIRVSGSGTQLDVPYTASSSDGGNAITSYTATSTPGSITGTLSQASSGTIRVSGLTQGTSYTFVVKATNSVGDSPNSAASNAIIPATVPSAPTIGTATILSNTSVSVSYTAGSNGGNAITSFTATSTPGSITGTVSQASSGSITVTGLTQGTSYTFVVKATNSIGDSPNSAATSAVTPANPPSAPTSIVATSTYNFVAVSFYAPSSNGGAPITSYTAVSYPDNLTSTVSQASGGSIYFTNSSLVRNQAYTFTIYATNSAGNSVVSSPSNAITYLGTPIQEAAYTIPGSYTWVAPAGVTSISVVAVGAGGAGSDGFNIRPGAGGSGGGLGYKNNYSVTAGNSYSLVVGSSPQAASGAPSYFISCSIVQGNGGMYRRGSFGNNIGTCAAGYVGDGGGHSGRGGGKGPGGTDYMQGGGGGAGGYAGNGGNGGLAVQPVSSCSNGANGSGGGGGGGYSLGAQRQQSGAGGGVGLYGQGPNGVGGTSLICAPCGPGLHGPTGQSGTSGSSGINPYRSHNTLNVTGGLFGGGGGGASCTWNPAGLTTSGYGGNGGLRIIWPGASRSFPSTNAGALFSGSLPCTPTIGTVTTSPSTITVPFTAAGNGGNTITSHRAISTPGNVVATVSQASSGSIVYSSNTLLSNNTAYTFKVYAVNSVGAGPQSSASNSITYIV